MPKRSISLKWKTMGLLGLALAIVNSGWLLYEYRTSLKDFEARQAADIQRKLGVVKRLLGQSHDRLQRIGNIVPSIMDTLSADSELEQRWTSLQLELELTVLVLVGDQGKLLHRGLPGYGDSLPEEIRQRVHQALESEQPDQFLMCLESCAQYALVPSLGPGGSQRLMLVARDLSDLVLELPVLTGADLAILAPGNRDLNWDGLGLFALSNAPVNEPRLRTLAGQHTLGAMTTGLSHSFDERTFRLMSRPWREFGGIGEGYIVLLEDSSPSLQRISAQTYQSLLGGLAALGIAILFGWLILNRPMNQLRRLAEALPLLAEKAYAPVRQLIGNEHRQRSLPTEIDTLERLAIELTDRLEALENQVDARNLAIAEKVAELRRSQELNEKILANAPILIMMLSSDGRIAKVNEFTCTLLGYGQVELEEKPFLSLLADARQSREAGDVMVDLIAGRRSVFEQTGPVRCVDGDLEQISWMHSRLVAQAGVYILALGLPDRTAAGSRPD